MIENKKGVELSSELGNESGTVDNGAVGGEPTDQGTSELGRPGTISRRDVLKYGMFGTAGAALALKGLRAPAEKATPESSFAKKVFYVTRPITLTYWCWAGGDTIVAQANSIIKAFPKQFGNITFDLSTFDYGVGGDFGLAAKFSLALTGHTQVPDMMHLNYTEVSEFAGTGAIVELDQYYTPAVKNNLYAGALATALVGGHYWDFPYQLNGKVCYYRSDLFEAAGLDASTIPTWTVDEFIDAGKKFTAKFPGKYIMNLGNEPVQYLVGELISAYSPPDNLLHFANQSGKYDITTNPAFGDVLGFIREVRKSGIAYPVDDFTTDWPAAIEAEHICGFIIAAWMDEFLPSYATMSAYGKWSAIEWPSLAPLQNEQYGSDAGGSVTVIPEGGVNKNLAMEFGNVWHFTEEGALATFEATGILPTLKSAEEPCLASLATAKKPASMSETDWKELPQNYFGGLDYMKLKFASQDKVQAFGYDPQAEKDWNTIMIEWMDKCTAGTVSVQAALEGMQHDMESEVGNPWTTA